MTHFESGILNFEFKIENSSIHDLRKEKAVDVQPLDLSKLRILPLAERRSLTRAEEILVDPDAAPPPCPDPAAAKVDAAVAAIRAARDGAPPSS